MFLRERRAKNWAASTLAPSNWTHIMLYTLVAPPNDQCGNNITTTNAPAPCTHVFFFLDASPTTVLI
jgi:hypothetical protein